MSEAHLTADENFSVYAEKLRELHRMFDNDKGDSLEANVLREEMLDNWERMSIVEQHNARALSVELKKKARNIMEEKEMHSERPSLSRGRTTGDSSVPRWIKVLFGTIALSVIILTIWTPIEMYQRHNAPIVSREPAGKIMSVRRLSRIPGGFAGGGTSAKTEVVTDQLATVFYGHPLIKIGAESEILKDSKGAFWFTWQGAKRYKISNNYQ